MKLYFAGYTTAPELLAKENVLESYLAVKKNSLTSYYEKYSFQGKLFLDSGAFSAATIGKIIGIESYIDYIKQNEAQLELYAGLDVIGDHKKTRENIEIMEREGLHPLPTFHFGSPMEELDRMLDKYSYIALGGLVPHSLNRRKLQSFLDQCFARIIKKKTKIHGFGVSAYWAWERYPFYSVDSTSWISGSKYGKSNTFNGKRIVGEKNKLKEKFQSKNVHYKIRLKNAIDLYVQQRDFITNLWQKRGYDYQD